MRDSDVDMKLETATFTIINNYHELEMETDSVISRFLNINAKYLIVLKSLGLNLGYIEKWCCMIILEFFYELGKI